MLDFIFVRIRAVIFSCSIVINMVDDFVCIIIVDNLFRIRELVVRCFVKQVHLDYLEAGANIIITASYQVPLFF